MTMRMPRPPASGGRGDTRLKGISMNDNTTGLELFSYDGQQVRTGDPQ